MKLPALLIEKFSHDHKLNAFVSHAVARISGHIGANDLIFFPEYTDHGLPHLEATLQTAIDLASTASKEKLTSQDAATLVVAASLHDLGMYLTRDGFETLISHGAKWRGIPFFDKASWEELWSNFYAEATRFDGRKLKALFGENYRPVRPLPGPGQPWEDFDYMLIGEFLRRHHPRLAHEIAIYGLPAKDGQSIPICLTSNKDEEFLADICGLIARSHGIDLRTCIDYLVEKYQNKVDPRRVHIIFLSVLLRISDYFQLQASRAPTERTDVTSFRSTFSENEWRVHQSVTDINNTGSDPEALVINAIPGDVVSFLRLKEWLEGIQQELDKSWAILGEVFGLHTQSGLDRLGLRIRRVRSNLDDVEKFSTQINYVPARISFEAANADLLKLLVAPLYGDSPEIGLRELIQNAIDAVREFEDLNLHHPQLQAVERPAQDADVTLRVECSGTEKVKEIIITDKGVGMTPQIIQEFFLRAGASFRKSDAWKREHEDAEGHSRILRTGRFGVGALAAFLLGDEIEVTTRHALAGPTEGVTFTARIDDDKISLERATCPVGTKIRIKVPEHLQNHVGQIIPDEWEQGRIRFSSPVGHYFLKKPSLTRSFSILKKESEPRDWLPQPDEEASADWRCFNSKNFEKIFWSYSSVFPAISCNGIVVTHRNDREHLTSILRKPRVSVFDKDGHLPVNLQRTGLQSEKFPFHNELLQSIADDLTAYAISEGPTQGESTWLDGSYPGSWRASQSSSYLGRDAADWLLTPSGFFLNDPFLIRAISPEYLVVGVGGQKGYYGWGNAVRSAVPSKTVLLSHLPGGLGDFNNRIKGLFQDVMNGSSFFPAASYEVQEIFIPEPTIQKIKKQLRPGKHVQADIAAIEKAELTTSGWRYARTAELDKRFTLRDTILPLSIDERNPTMFFSARIHGWNDIKSDKSISDQWLSNIDSVEIPFSLQRRRGLEKSTPEEIQKILRIRREALRKNKKNEENSSG